MNTLRLWAAAGKPLTDRDRRLLRLVAEGHRYADIAAREGVALGTVRDWMAVVSGKLGASNLPHAVHLAWQRGELSS